MKNSKRNELCLYGVIRFFYVTAALVAVSGCGNSTNKDDPLQNYDSSGYGTDTTVSGVDTTGSGTDTTVSGVDTTGSGTDTTGKGTDTYPDVDDPYIDDDSDGYSNVQGDCYDYEPFVNPDAIEDLGPDGKGDGVDNDCDGLTDEDETCDTEEKKGSTLDYLGKTPDDLAAAINLCDKRYYLGSEKLHSNKDNFDIAYDTFDKMGQFGCFAARQGFQLAAIATGNVWQPDSNQANPIDSDVIYADDPQPLFQGESPVKSSTKKVCDVTQFKVHLKAPSNAHGFSFDFLFASAEYKEFLNSGWNDTFYAILEYSPVNGGKTTNISFDSNGNEIEVDANFFENEEFKCDERQTGWDPNLPQGAGSTGWLRTSWPINHPGDEFYLTFSIHDEGQGDGHSVDYGWDSIALIDNFKWITHEVDVKPETVPVIID